MLTVNNLSIILLLQLLLLFNGILCESDQFEGESCEWKGMPGVCTLLKNCESIKNDLRVGKIKPYELKSCAFKGNEPVTCCTDAGIISKVADASTQTEPKRQTGDIFFPGMIPRVSSTSPRSQSIVKRPAVIACENLRKQFPHKRIDQKIVDGVNAYFGEFPHMAALGYGQSDELQWLCAGTLISERYILTAGHCVRSRNNLPRIARLGRNNIDAVEKDDDNPLDVDIENITLHNKYIQSQSYNDIALIRLAQPVEYKSGLHAACLYTNTDDLSPTINLTITGWGTVDINTRAKSSLLQKATVNPVTLEECIEVPIYKTEKSLPRGILKNQLCALHDTSDTCQGDSGGPIQVTDETSISVVHGVTSFGISCGSQIPGIYTRVASFLDWLEPIVWPNLIN